MEEGSCADRRTGIGSAPGRIGTGICPAAPGLGAAA